MKKIISCLLSFLMIYTSIIPSYAEALDNAERSAASSAVRTDLPELDIKDIYIPGYRSADSPLAQEELDKALGQCPKGYEVCTTAVMMPNIEVIKGIDLELARVSQEEREKARKKDHQDLKDFLAEVEKVKKAFNDLTSDAEDGKDELDEKSDYEYYQEAYREAAKGQYEKELGKIQAAQRKAKKDYQSALKKCALRKATEEECKGFWQTWYDGRKRELEEQKAGLQQRYREVISEKQIAAGYQRDAEAFGKELKRAKKEAEAAALEQGRKYLQDLAHEFLLYKNVKNDNEAFPLQEDGSFNQTVYHMHEHRQEWPQVVFHNVLEDTFPIFLAVGGLDKKDRKEASRLLQKEMKLADHCTNADGDEDYYCQRSIRAAGGLLFLGEGNLTERGAFDKFAKAGMKASQRGAEMILTGGIGLLEFGGTENFKGLVRTAMKGDYDWTDNFKYVSLEYWAEEAHAWINGRRWFTENTHRTGAYLAKSDLREEEKVVRSAWTDLGRYAAVKARMDRDEKLQDALDMLMEKDLLIPGEDSIGLKFPAFLQGMYEGYYDVPSLDKIKYNKKGWKQMYDGLAKDLADGFYWGKDINGFILYNLISMGKPDIDGATFREIQFRLSNIYFKERSYEVKDWFGDDDHYRAYRRWRDEANKSEYCWHCRTNAGMRNYDDASVAAHQRSYDYMEGWRPFWRGADIALAIYGAVTIVTGGASVMRTARIASQVRQGKTVREFAKMYKRVVRLGRGLNIASRNATAAARAAAQVARADRVKNLVDELAVTRGIKFSNMEAISAEVAHSTPTFSAKSLELGTISFNASELARGVGSSLEGIKSSTTSGAFSVVRTTAEELETAQRVLKEAIVAEKEAGSVSGKVAQELRLQRQLAQAQVDRLTASQRFYEQLASAERAVADTQRQAELLEGYHAEGKLTASSRAVKGAQINLSRAAKQAQGLSTELENLRGSYLTAQQQVWKLESELRELQSVGEIKIRPLVPQAHITAPAKPTILGSLKNGYQIWKLNLPTWWQVRMGAGKAAATILFPISVMTTQLTPAVETFNAGRAAVETTLVVNGVGRAANTFVVAGSLAGEAGAAGKTIGTIGNAARATYGTADALWGASNVARSGMKMGSLLPSTKTLVSGFGILNFGNLWMAPSLMAYGSEEERRARAQGTLGSGKIDGIIQEAMLDYAKQSATYKEYVKSLEGQYALFAQLQQRQQNYLSGNATIRMEYDRLGYPITGRIQSGWKTIEDYFYLKYVAPWAYRNNPFYQGYNQLQRNPLFVNGQIQEEVAHSLGESTVASTVKPVLSMGGLGTLSARVDDYINKKAASSAFYKYAQRAYAQVTKDVANLAEISAVEYASILINYFATLLRNDKKLSTDKKTEFLELFKTEVQDALETGNLVTDDVLVSFPWKLRKKVGRQSSILVSYMDVNYENKTFRVAAKYHFIRTASQYKNPALASEKSNLIADRILREEAPNRESLVWIMASAADEKYKLLAYYRMADSGYQEASVEEIIKTHLGLNKNSELVTKLSNEEAAALQTVQRLSVSQTQNLMEAVPASEQLFTVGFDEADLLQINEQKLNYVLYSAQDVLPVMNLMETVDAQGNKTYKNYLPVYLRYQDGSLSPRPLIYMTVTGKKGVTVPAGFVVAVDEKGQWKYVPVNLRQAQKGGHLMATWPLIGKLFSGQKNANKMLAASRAERRIIMESNLKTSEIQALLMQLRKGQGTDQDKYVAVLRMAEPDKFEAMINEVALVAGADLGASLSSQFKKTLNSSALSILFSGFGYISPLIANLFKPLINTFGAYRTLQVGLAAMIGVSLWGMSNGMWGYFTLPETFGRAYAPVLTFLATAIIVASVFSTIASPILKSAYPDQVLFASKNLSFTTTKGLSRMLVGLIPILAMLALGNPTIHDAVNQGLSVVGTSLPEGKLNWSLLTPIVGLVSAMALWNLSHSRLKAEEKARIADLKNSPEGQKSVWQRIMTAYTAKDPASVQRERIFKEVFVPKMRDIAGRLGQIYMAYAPVNSVFIGIAAGLLFSPSTALTITMLGSFMNYMARKGFNLLLKNKIITDDQLTGLLLPVMAVGILAVAAMPYTAIMASSSTALKLLMIAPWWLMQVATSTFGVAESSRMQNLVAQYYKDEREKVRADESLTEEQREAKLKELKAAESDMKMNAAKLYNKNNSKGMLTILGMIAGAYLMTEATWLPWVAEGASKDGTLLLNVLRATLLPSVILGAILNLKNKEMVKEGFQWFAQLNKHLTQEVIDQGDIKAIATALKMDLSRVKTMQNQLTAASEELLTETRGYANSLTSESRIAGLLSRAILLNDRLKVFIDNEPNGAEDKVKTALMNLRMISYNLHVLLDGNGILNSLDRVEGNDVSSVLRGQAAQFFASVRGLEFSSDSQVHEFMDRLRQIRQETDSETIGSLVLTLQVYLQNMDAENFDKAFRVLSNKLKDPQLTAQGKAISNLLKGNTPAVTAANLNYLPEILNKQRVNITNYERALDARREMRTIIAEYKAGTSQLYDGMLEDVQKYYDQAMKALDDYLKDNAALLNEETDPRVQELRQELNKMYEEFFQGKAPISAPASASPTSSKVPRRPVHAQAAPALPALLTIASALSQGAFAMSEYIQNAWKYFLTLGLALSIALPSFAAQATVHPQADVEQESLHQKSKPSAARVLPTYALPVSRFIMGTDNMEATALTMEEAGADANRPGLTGFKAWISKFVLGKSTGLDWGTLQELHALYQEALAGNAAHLSLMNEATQAVMGEQDGKFFKLKFLNNLNQNIF